MKKFAISVVVFVLMILATIAFDVMAGIMIYEDYLDIESVALLVSMILGVTALDINYLKNFVRD